MEKKAAFIIPIYPPHYEFWRKFYQSFIDNKLDDTSDFYYVFSDKKDSELFWEFENKIVLPNDLLERCINNKSHMPDVKKFYALNELKDEYEYLIIVDAESLIVKNVDVPKVCLEYFNNKTLYWNAYNKNVRQLKFIIDTSLSRVPHEKIDENIDLYLRFNQPCIYKTQNLDDFFWKTKVLEDIDHLIFWEFDYYIYMFYLICYEWFHVYDIWIKAYNSFCEAASRKDFRIINDNYRKCKFLSCTQFVCDFLSPNNWDVFLIHHLDRRPQWLILKLCSVIWWEMLEFKRVLVNFYSLIKKKCNF